MASQRALDVLDATIAYINSTKPSNMPTASEEESKGDRDHRFDTIAILDAGSQFGKVIDRRVRELCLDSELLGFDTAADDLRNYKAIIISGGPSSVYAEDAPKYDPNIFQLNIPILGICYGMQLMAHHFNGKIESGHKREDGQFMLNIEKSDLFESLHEQIEVLLTHGDVVTDPGTNFKIIGKSADNGIISAVENADKKLYGLQFHPEVDLTPDGKKILHNFLFNICRCEANYTVLNRKDIAFKYIQKIVGKKKVLSLVSGGVDSSVCTALLQAALEKDQVYPVHIDTGLMRKDESAKVYKAMFDVGVDCHVVNARDEFLNGTTETEGPDGVKVTTPKLCEATEPEIKRKIIGDVFMKLCDKAVKQKWPDLNFNDMILAQGTLRPDLIESASNIANKGGTADCIKTHHNDTPLVRLLRLANKVVEPLQDYHKDEVRALGLKLGLPEHLVLRQPFPGPGLGIRVICTGPKPYETPADAQILHALKTNFECDEIACCLLGFRTVGVQGDGRTYAHCVGLSFKKPYSLTSKNNEISNLPWKKLYQMARDIPGKIRGINRVIFVFSKRACLAAALESNDANEATNDEIASQSPKSQKSGNFVEVPEISDMVAKSSYESTLLPPNEFGGSMSGLTTPSRNLETSPGPLGPLSQATSYTESDVKDFNEMKENSSSSNGKDAKNSHILNEMLEIESDAPSGACKDVTETHLNGEVLDSLRECDDIVNEMLLKHDLIHSISQVPVILFPSNFGKAGKRSCCIRTFMTNDFMTGKPAVIDRDLPSHVLRQMVVDISQVKGIERVAFDLTPKPPGTTEWE